MYRDQRDRLFGAPGRWSISKCTGCGLLWLDPMPLEGDLSKAYRSYYTHAHETSKGTPLREFYKSAQHAYISRALGYPRKQLPALGYLALWLIRLLPGRRLDAAFQAFFLPARPGGRLLEIGCGHGAAMSTMRELGWNAEGVDFDPAAVEAARAKGLVVRLGGLRDQHYPPESFDAVVMSHVIEHLPDPRELLRECLRVLKPGGQLVMVTPNASSWGHWLYGADWRGLEPPRHLHIFSVSSLRAVAAQAGFARIECRSVVRGARGMFLASKALARKPSANERRSVSPLVRLQVEAMEIGEAIGASCGLQCGEELLLRATK